MSYKLKRIKIHTSRFEARLSIRISTVACIAGFPCPEFIVYLAGQELSAYYPNAAKCQRLIVQLRTISIIKPSFESPRRDILKIQ
jgi:hypothetical protein